MTAYEDALKKLCIIVGLYIRFLFFSLPLQRVDLLRHLRR